MERLAAQADQRRVELGFPEWSRVKGAGLANLFTVQMDLPDRAARMWRDRIGFLTRTDGSEARIGATARGGWVRGGVVRTGAVHLALPRTFPCHHADPRQSRGPPGEKGSFFASPTVRLQIIIDETKWICGCVLRAVHNRNPVTPRLW